MNENTYTTLFKPLKKQHICERCGKIRPKHLKVNFQVNGATYRDIGWIALRAGSGYERDIDLCEDCMRELADWMKKFREDSIFYEIPVSSVAHFDADETKSYDNTIKAPDIFELWSHDVSDNWLKATIKKYEPAPEYGPHSIKVYYRSGSSEILTSNPEGTKIISRHWISKDS